eukprot:g27840.t1
MTDSDQSSKSSLVARLIEPATPSKFSPSFYDHNKPPPGTPGLHQLQGSASVASIAEIALAYDVGLRTSGRWFGGVVEDMRRRREHLLNDFAEAFRAPRKVLSASLFMFFATWSSTMALGELVRRQTNGQMGVTEYLLLQGVCGMLHALFSAQPLLILRPTGPVTVFVVQLSVLATRLGFNFYSWIAWVGLWVGFYMVLIASFDGSHYIKFMTRFLHEMYETFVCTIYASDGIIAIVSNFRGASAPEDFGRALFNMLLAAIVVCFGLLLSQSRKMALFTPDMRRILADFALPIAIGTAIALSYSSSAVEVDRIVLPSGSLSPTSERVWLASLAVREQPDLVAAAMLAALPITSLFYIDQSVSALLTQVPSMQLSKGSYYHQPFLLAALFNGVMPLFGLPFITASLPHSPQFASSLTRRNVDGIVVKVHENRIAPLLVFALCLCSIYFKRILEVVPMGVVDGILTFVGVFGLLHNRNQFVERLLLLLTPSENSRAYVTFRGVSHNKIHAFTLIQLICFIGCWLLVKSPAGLFFPFLILLLVPLRNRLLPCWFTDEELDLLDGADVNSHCAPEHVGSFSCSTNPNTHSERVPRDPHYDSRRTSAGLPDYTRTPESSLQSDRPRASLPVVPAPPFPLHNS